MQSARIRFHLAPALCLAAFAVIMAQTTHFGYFTDGSYGYDAGIFAYIGHAMNSGRMLYTQVWENKGPLLYLINMLGVALSYYHGIYFIELFSLAAALLFAYKAALIFTGHKRWLALTAVLFSFLLLAVTLEGGNLSEEYALPFTCAALFIITKFCFNDYKLRNYELILFGVCASAVFMLRANICAFFIPMLLFPALALARKKLWKELTRAVLLTLAGAVLAVLPVAVYLASGGALLKCINDAYLSILNSFSPISKIELLTNVYAMVKTTFTTGTAQLTSLFLLAYILCRVRKLISDSRVKLMLDISFCGLLLNFFANSLSGANHMHYFITFVPIIVIPAAWLISSLAVALRGVTGKETFANLTVCAAILFLSFNGILLLCGNVLSNSNYRKKETVNPVVRYIDEHTEADDLIQVIGGDATLNYQTKRLTASRHLHFASGRFSDDAVRVFADEISTDILSARPRLLLFGSDRAYQKFMDALTQREGFELFLQSNYEPHEVISDYLIYKLTY